MSQKNPNDLTLTIVVATLPVTVTVNANQHITQLIRDALRAAGKPPDQVADWFLRTAQGQEFSPDQKINTAGIIDGMTLYLTQDAGGGG